ncbi:hypothetical protein ATCC90586_004510 [Pythium insidiosum]|nr:hypothetical protein ATCC90586_004510 [Pythium insidiosum]
MWLSGLLLGLYPLLAALAALLYVAKKRRVYAHQRRHAHSDPQQRVLTVGVFHPYANGGGGGERVLYCALLALLKHVRRCNLRDVQRASPLSLRVLLFAGDDGLTAAQLLHRAADRFNLPELLTLQLDAHVRLVPLALRYTLEPERYPRFTLLWQAVAHMRLAVEAFRTGERLGVFPDVWLDTTGCAFSYVVARVLYACTVVAYVHYPMISTDMIAKVQQRSTDFNNDAAIASSAARSTLKLLYYRVFAAVYGLVGRLCTDVVLVNSTWTYRHIKALWGGEPVIVYPPCGDMEELLAMPSDAREPALALSISQFRPEKNQRLQLEALHVLLTKHGELVRSTHPALKLVLLGSCRNADDEARVKLLREQCADLGLSASVEFVVNASFAELKKYLARASIGLHTMYNEHFGISIVEMMAAGLVVIANNSGGPAADIVQPGTGFLALTADEYAERMLRVLQATADETDALRSRARDGSRRFSDLAFEEQLVAAIERAVFGVLTPSPAERS